MIIINFLIGIGLIIYGIKNFFRKDPSGDLDKKLMRIEEYLFSIGYILIGIAIAVGGVDILEFILELWNRIFH